MARSWKEVRAEAVAAGLVDEAKVAEHRAASVAYPQYDDPMQKFQAGGWPCGPGLPVEDTATLFDGEPCCSSCRSRMTLVDATWVHVQRAQRGASSDG